MPFVPDEEGPARQSGFIPDEVAPGDSPENPIDQMHPVLSTWTRFKLMNLTVSSAQAARNLKKEGFDVVDRGDYNISLRKPGGKWYVMDSSKREWRDILDIPGDIASGIGMGIGATAAVPATATGPGAVAAGMGGAAVGGAAVEAVKGGVGALLGLEPETGELIKESLKEGAWGAAGEGVLRAAKPVAKFIGKGVGKLFKAPAAVEEAISGQAARDRVLREGQRITTQQGLKAGEKRMLSAELKGAKGEADILRKEASLGFQQTRTRFHPAITREAEALAALREATLQASRKAEEALRKSAGLDAERLIRQALEEVPEPEIAKGGIHIFAGPAKEARTPFEVFRRVIDSDIPHPAHIYASALLAWPEYSQMVSRVFRIPLEKLAGIQGLSKDLRRQMFWQLFRKVGTKEFTAMSREYEKEAAKLLLTTSITELDQTQRLALSRLISGIPKDVDKAVLAERLLDVMAKLQRGDPKVRAAQKAYKEAQAVASRARANIAAAQDILMPKVGAATAKKLEIEKKAIPKMKKLEQELAALQIERAANVHAAKETLPTRRYPYWGRHIVETGLKTLATTGHALEWVTGGPTPQSVKWLVEDVGEKIPAAVREVLGPILGEKLNATARRVGRLIQSIRRSAENKIAKRALWQSLMRDPEVRQFMGAVVGLEE